MTYIVTCIACELWFTSENKDDKLCNGASLDSTPDCQTTKEVNKQLTIDAAELQGSEL